jgi:hypothetical protein
VNFEELLREGLSEPTGAVARAEDGRMFFIPDELGAKFAVHRSDLHNAFQIAFRTIEGPASCARSAEVKRWLDTHDPRTELWQRVCVRYLDEC